MVYPAFFTRKDVLIVCTLHGLVKNEYGTGGLDLAGDEESATDEDVDDFVRRLEFVVENEYVRLAKTGSLIHWSRWLRIERVLCDYSATDEAARIALADLRELREDVIRVLTEQSKHMGGR